MGPRTEKAWLLEGAGTAPASAKRKDKAKDRNGGRARAGAAKPASAAKGSAGKDGPPARASRQWLAVPRPKSEKGVAGKKAGAQPSAPRKVDRSPTRDRRRIASRLRRAEQTVESQASTIEELKGEVASLRRELADRAAPQRRAAPVSSGKRSNGGRRRVAKPTRADANTVSFEQLRALGLSVTQSARLIAARETRDGFTRIEELDQLPGFSRETIADLRQTLSVRRRR